MGEKTKEQVGKGSRAKGAGGERELARILKDEYGYETRRGFTFNRQSDVVGLPGIHIECKRVENLNLRKALDQSVREAKVRRDGLPVVMYRKNYRKWKVAMQLDHFLELLRVEAKAEDRSQIVRMDLDEWMDVYGDYANE